MPKLKWSEDKISQFQREGRGKGTFAEYHPWIEISDFSSVGKSRRVFSHKTGRVHHLLSDVEYQLFLLLEFSEHVLDIREQFPLPRDETLSIAARKNIKHPAYPGTKVHAVMTTDFLVDVNRGGICSREAYSCKRENGVDGIRDLEKLEIERGFFDAVEIPFYLVFYSALPHARIKNLEWIRGATAEDDSRLANDKLDGLCARMRHELQQNQRSGSLAEYCANFDSRTGSQTGTGLLVVRALLCRRELLTDLNQADLAAAPICMFHATPSGYAQLRVVGA